MAERQQQKVYLTPGARAKLRDEAEAREMEMSAVVEHLIVDGQYPPEVKHQKAKV